MKKFVFLALCCMCLLYAQAQQYSARYADGIIYFKLRNDVSLTLPQLGDRRDLVDLSKVEFLRSIASKYHITALRSPFYITDSPVLQRTFRLEFSDYAHVDQIIEDLKKTNIIEYAEKLPMAHTAYTPNDPRFKDGSQGHLTVINATKAWDYSKGSANIVVAVIDNAIDINHTDLKANIWVNSDEIANNGKDDDNDGSIDNINGWDYGDDDSNPAPDYNSMNHGTHCAGLVGAVSDNNTGIASIGFGIRIMAMKLSKGSSSDPNTFSVAPEAITNAVDAGARVLSMSLTIDNTDPVQAIKDACAYAYSKGCVIVVAAGNDNSSTVAYPAGFPGCIAVASTTNSDKKSSFSNYGSWIDVSAPGGETNGSAPQIYSTFPGNTYGNDNGTSMATPIVAGLCGLMLSLNPSMKNTEVEDCLKSTAVNIDSKNSGYAGKLGAGRIDAGAAMKCANDKNTVPPVADFLSANTSSCSGTVAFTDKTTGNPTSWSWDFGDGGTSTQQNPTHTYVTNGSFTVKLTASNVNGPNTSSKPSYITINKPAGPVAPATGSCGGGSATLTATPSASGNTINWYDSKTATTPVGTGTSYVTPTISSAATYYAEEIVGGASQKVGAVDNTLNSGGYFNDNDTRGLLFDVTTALRIKSVKVYANTAGDRTIEVRKGVGGTVIATTTVNIPAGESRVTLNFDLPAGKQYHIKVTGSLVDLYRNNGGAQYPYSLANLLTITESDAAADGYSNYYYYFYDWEVSAGSCVSLLTEVPVSMSPAPTIPVITQNGDLLTSTGASSYQWYLDNNPIVGATSQNYTVTQPGSYKVEITDANGCKATSAEQIITGLKTVDEQIIAQLFPNPNNGSFTLKLPALINTGYKVEICNVLGQTVYDITTSGSLQKIDVGSLPNGIYMLRLMTDQYLISKSVIIEK